MNECSCLCARQQRDTNEVKLRKDFHFDEDEDGHDVLRDHFPRNNLFEFPSSLNFLHSCVKKVVTLCGGAHLFLQPLTETLIRLTPIHVLFRLSHRLTRQVIVSFLYN